MDEPTGFVFVKEGKSLALGFTRALHLLHHSCKMGMISSLTVQVWELKAERPSPSRRSAQLGRFAPTWVGLGLSSPRCPLLPLLGITSRPLSWRTFGIPGPLAFLISDSVKTLRLQISNPCIYILSSLPLTLSIIIASIPHNNRLLGSRKDPDVPLVSSIPAQ